MGSEQQMGVVMENMYIKALYCFEDVCKGRIY